MQMQSCQMRHAPWRHRAPQSPPAAGPDSAAKLPVPSEACSALWPHLPSLLHTCRLGLGHPPRAPRRWPHGVLLLGELPPHDLSVGNFIPKEESTFQNHVLNE